MRYGKIVIFVFIFFSTFIYAAKEIIIDLKNQKIYAIEDSVIMMDDKISSGKKGYRTPAGKFKILENRGTTSRPYITYLCLTCCG